jgi:hypothetical protein
LEPRSFSFNSPYGACPACNGLGSKYDFDPSKVIVDWTRPVFEGALGPGSVIDLGRSPDEPVDVLISNRVVARGDVVIVSGNYGVRVRDVVSQTERARSLEAELA